MRRPRHRLSSRAGYTLEISDTTTRSVRDHSDHVTHSSPQAGSVFIEDRKKELIKVKGLQVAPAELENTIRSMEGVVDVAVIGSVLQCSVQFN